VNHRSAQAARLVEALVLAALTADAAAAGPLTRWESAHIRPPRRWPPAAAAISAVGSPRVLLAGGCGALLTRRRGVSSVLAAVAGRRVLADVVARPRPPQDWWRERPHGHSFPSRHTTYAMLLFWLLPRREHSGWTEAAMATSGILVGSARLRRGVHWPTDVLAAVLATDLAWHLVVAGDLCGPLASLLNGAVRSAPRTAVPADDLYPMSAA